MGEQYINALIVETYRILLQQIVQLVDMKLEALKQAAPLRC